MFMLFTGHNYYPGGGWNDFRGFFFKEEDALRIAKQQGSDWYQLVGAMQDGVTGVIKGGRIEDL